MTVLTNSFDAGPDATQITTGNSGGVNGDAFDLVNETLNPEYDDAQTMHGPFSMLVPSGTGLAEMRWTDSFVASSEVAVRIYARFGSVAPTLGQSLIQFRDSGGARIGYIVMSTDGRILAYEDNDALISGTNISGHAISANTWYRIETIYTIGASASTGRVQYAVYLGDSLTPEFTFDTGSTANLALNDIDRVYMGKLSNGAAMNGDYNFEEFAIDTAPAGYIGPLVVAGPLVETQTDANTLIEVTGGTPPFTIAQTAGTTTAATELDDGSVSGTGQWLVKQSSSEALTYEVTDDAAVVSDPYVVPQIPAASNSQQLRPTTGTAPGSTWV